MKKRGVMEFGKSQASIFMIMAVIVLLLGVVYFLYQKSAVEGQPDEVQPEVLPVKAYVEDCIKTVAEDGLELIGLSGGYVSIPPQIANNPRAYLTSFPGQGFKMPYWWYDGISSVPSEDFINLQLKEFIESEFPKCIDSFEPFRNRFEVSQLKNPSAEVRFNENDVHVSVKYPLEISLRESGFRASMEEFGYTIPVRFRKVYELAAQIMDRENKDEFLERRTIDLYSSDITIPTTDVEVRCKERIWQLPNIKQQLQSLLRVNLPYIRVAGTDYNPDLYVPNPDGESIYSKTYFQQHYVWEIDTEPGQKYKNMKVAFTYDNWPLSIYSRPSESGILKSNAQKGTSMLSFFCLQIWHFTYDINYPVMVTIIDQATSSNREYRFNFGFRVAIGHNQPDRANRGITSFDSDFGLSDDEFCNDATKEITVFTVNNATGEDIKGVNLTFVCGRYYCDMGQSDWLSFGAAAGITAKMPYCVNAVIRGSKDGFADAQSFMQADADGNSGVLRMNPMKQFSSYRILKHPLSSPGSFGELAEDEKATILISSNDSSYASFAVYPQNPEFPLTIPDGKDAAYDITIYVADGENLAGGYIGQWKVSKSALSSASEVVFHVVSHDASSEDEQALFAAGLDSYSKKVPQPEMK